MPKARGETAQVTEAAPPPGHRTLAWARPDQTDLLARVAHAAGLTLIAAGSPEPGRGGQVASALGAEHATDLRAALASTDARLVLLADPGPFGSGTGDDDIAAILAARARGATIATLEPIPPTALDLANPGWMQTQTGGPAIEALRPAALPRHTLAIRALRDALEHFGPVRSLAAEFLLPRAAGSLGAALVGVTDLVLALLGEPESIDAAYIGPGAGTALRALPAQSLRGLEGDLAAMARLPDGRAASILASDRAGAWSCSLTLLGEGGTLRAGDAGFVWTDPAGTLVERHEAQPAPAWQVIAQRLTALLDPAAPDEAPADLPTVLTIAQAALLSARTGQAESPQTIQRILSRH